MRFWQSGAGVPEILPVSGVVANRFDRSHLKSNRKAEELKIAIVKNDECSLGGDDRTSDQ
ncbi:hypothetical protein [Microcoleus sp. PH2017_34_RAT_O_A]|uniref:hypothetical protein n=1 Tax=Microcoleus sp. PH2017_34_RAT_O_A TaxID=2798844 RepID=UPI0025DCE336|nr:hypothetical protein [Microcoleus sp. PH2017_34_RAT_O_A]